MANLISFSVSGNFVELDQRIEQIYKIDSYDDKITKTVELLEDISRSTAVDSVAYATGMSEQMDTLGNVMAVYVMSKVWESSIYGLRDVRSDQPEKSILIDTDEYGNSFYRHPINASKVRWLVEYAADRQ